MKKLVNTAFIYAILALVAGVFYREFTKFTGFEGKTTLSVLHVHLFAMGMLFFLVVTSLNKTFALTDQVRFKKFFITYNAGMAVTVIMFLVRGITQVLATPLSKGATAAISGFAGIGHIITTIGLILFFTILKKQAAKL